MEQRIMLQNVLLNVVDYLKPLLPLTNSHLVNFITKQLWECNIPSCIRQEVSNLDADSFFNLFQTVMSPNYLDKIQTGDHAELIKNNPAVFTFFKNASEMSLKNHPDITLSRDACYQKLNYWNARNKNEVHGDAFMSPKKMHEVNIMTKLISLLTNASSSMYVVDVGSGKGYLSSVLALEHGIQVLGIDSSHTNTHSAKKRAEKIQKVRKRVNVKIKSDDEEATTTSETPCHGMCDSEHFQQVTMYVTEETNVIEIIKEKFGGASCDSVCLAGLHTCGDLAPTCLRLFCNDIHIKSLCNVGCCCNHLTEGCEKQAGFPMSQCLRSLNFKLGRNSRMLAAQSVERITNHMQVPLDSLLYRAILEVLLVDKLGENISWTYVGRLASKCKDFQEYVEKALKKLNLDITISKNEIESAYKKYVDRNKELRVYFLFRVALAPVIETVILLDRLLYLKEQGIEESYLVPLFDPVISPRCYGIIALKDVPLCM